MTTDPGPPTVAVLGLGAMGAPAAAALARTHRVLGFDPDHGARERAAAAGVELAGSAEDAVRSAEVVLLSLPTPAHGAALVESIGTGWTSKLVVDLSTIGPDDARAQAASLAAFTCGYVDAPVLGRPAGCGSWVLVAGGAAADVAVLETLAVGRIARSVRRVGDVGAGATLKLANNLMFGAINAAAAEAVALVEAAGLDPAVFVDTVSASGAATVSPLFVDVAPKMASRTYDPTFRLELLAKDLELAGALARRVGGRTPVTAAVLELLRTGLAAGLGADDSAALVEVYRRG